MTTGGEGGMVTTNDESTWRKMWAFKDHGKSFEAVYERQHPPGFRWLHESFGTNWRMLEMQAVIGRIQLRRMKKWKFQRHAHAEVLIKALAPFSGENGGIRMPLLQETDGSEHAYYKFYVYIKPENLAPGWSRDRIIEAINMNGVPCYQGSCSEIYLEKAFECTDWRPTERLPTARKLGETSLMFLVHPTLKDAEMQKTTEVIREVLEKSIYVV